tara:strand:- start:447 stop:1241 length:795 start_codon:yes stop_codon:yes gene_type:complete
MKRKSSPPPPSHNSDGDSNDEIERFAPNLQDKNPRPSSRLKTSPPQIGAHVTQQVEAQRQARPPTPHPVLCHGLRIRNPEGPVPREIYNRLQEENQRLQEELELLRREHAEFLARSQRRFYTARTRGMQVQANAHLQAHNQRLMAGNAGVVGLKNRVRKQEERIGNQILEIQRLEAQIALEKDIKAGKYTNNGDVVEGHFRAELKAYQRAAYELKRENQRLKRENNELKDVAFMEGFEDMNLGGGNMKGGGSSGHIYNKLKLNF